MRSEPLVLRKIFQYEWSLDVYRNMVWFIQDIQMSFFYPQKIKPHYDKYFDFSYIPENGLFLNGYEYLCDDMPTKKLYEFYIKNYNKDPNFFNKIFKTEVLIVDKINKFIESLKLLHSNDSLEKYERYLNEFYILFVDSNLSAWIRPDDILEQLLDDLLKKELNLNVRKYNEIKQILTSPSNIDKLNYTSLKIDLLSANITNNSLKNICDKYLWMKDPEGKQFDYFSESDFKDQIIEIKDPKLELSRIIEYRKIIEEKIKNFIKSKKLNSKQIKLIEAVRDFVFLRTYCTEATQKLFWYSRKYILNQLTINLNISQEDIVMLTYDEIKVLLRKNISIKTIKNKIDKRNKGYMFISINAEKYLEIGENAYKDSKKIRDLLLSKNNNSKQIIKGISASKGIIAGIARIILDKEEISKIKNNEILVTSMTTPEFIIGMQKAIAFVTDEGGITCHAAIVARELGVPCIVGTKIATTKIKTGDLIEVDADNGYVKILKNE